MKRKIVIALMILLCFLLQSTVFQALAIGSISPNLMIILTASFGFMGGRKEGMIDFSAGCWKIFSMEDFLACMQSFICTSAMAMDSSTGSFTETILSCR